MRQNLRPLERRAIARTASFAPTLGGSLGRNGPEKRRATHSAWLGTVRRCSRRDYRAEVTLAQKAVKKSVAPAARKPAITMATSATTIAYSAEVCPSSPRRAILLESQTKNC